VIGEPLDEGKDQSILMLLPTCVVTGASGISGTVAHKMLNSSEKSERPNWFLACILNLYVSPGVKESIMKDVVV